MTRAVRDEVPDNWSDQPGSKTRLFRDGVALFRELAVIHRNAANGSYSPPRAPDSPSPLRSSFPVWE
ncbi:hypothetical protein ACO9S2_03875 [Nitrospira sp. NS4]|uniref:hypothetical protein n=1 Tax=Nitrospira sp. NS4 TaxID=3414498 RepID=UPI003C2D5578